MSYADIAALAQDSEFRNRLGASLTQEARPRVPGEQLSVIIMRNPPSGVTYFMPFVSVAPGFADAYSTGGQEAVDDGMMLAAVQDCWDEVASIWPAPAP